MHDFRNENEYSQSAVPGIQEYGIAEALLCIGRKYAVT